MHWQCRTPFNLKLRGHTYVLVQVKCPAKTSLQVEVEERHVLLVLVHAGLGPGRVAKVRVPGLATQRLCVAHSACQRHARDHSGDALVMIASRAALLARARGCVAQPGVAGREVCGPQPRPATGRIQRSERSEGAAACRSRNSPPPAAVAKTHRRLLPPAAAACSRRRMPPPAHSSHSRLQHSRCRRRLSRFHCQHSTTPAYPFLAQSLQISAVERLACLLSSLFMSVAPNSQNVSKRIILP